jgi:DNA-binding transcriptional LysR family regulator
MDRLGAMAMLVRVVENGSMSAAAKQMDVPVATISRRIAELEAHLKTRLLNRSSRRLNLTQPGRLYVEASRRILEQIEEAERATMGLLNDPKGQLVVTAPIVFGRAHMVPVIAEFLAQYPEIDVKLILADRLLDLLEMNVDVALRIGELSDSGLAASRLGRVRRVTCASPSYLAANGRPRTPDDLPAHFCVTFDNLASPEAWRFSSRKGDILAPVRSRLTVTTAEAAIAGAVHGLGLTRLLSYQVTDELRAGRLELVLEDFELPPWPVNLVFAGQSVPPLKLQAFLDFAAPRLEARLQAEEMSSGAS